MRHAARVAQEPPASGLRRWEDVMGDAFLELSDEQTMRREAAAARLRDLADQIARQNSMEVVRNGIRYTVKVPDEVKLKIEVEVGEKSEIEFEISW
jgi:amphi-Trp domain-containing protein